MFGRHWISLQAHSLILELSPIQPGCQPQRHPGPLLKALLYASPQPEPLRAWTHHIPDLFAFGLISTPPSFSILSCSYSQSLNPTPTYGLGP